MIACRTGSVCARVLLHLSRLAALLGSVSRACSSDDVGSPRGARSEGAIVQDQVDAGRGVHENATNRSVPRTEAARSRRRASRSAGTPGIPPPRTGAGPTSRSREAGGVIFWILRPASTRTRPMRDERMVHRRRRADRGDPRPHPARTRQAGHQAAVTATLGDARRGGAIEDDPGPEAVGSWKMPRRASWVCASSSPGWRPRCRSPLRRPRRTTSTSWSARSSVHMARARSTRQDWWLRDKHRALAVDGRLTVFREDLGLVWRVDPKAGTYTETKQPEPAVAPAPRPSRRRHAHGRLRLGAGVRLVRQGERTAVDHRQPAVPRVRGDRPCRLRRGARLVLGVRSRWRPTRHRHRRSSPRRCAATSAKRSR